MEQIDSSKEQDPGELLEQLSQMKIELARKQRKLKKCRRSEKVKAHVKQKLEEQAQLNEEYKSANDLSRSLSSTEVTGSSVLVLNQPHKEVKSNISYTEGRFNKSVNSQQSQNEDRLLQEKYITKQNSVADDDKQCEKNKMDRQKVKCNQIHSALTSHLKTKSPDVLTMKVTKTKMVSQVNETSLKLNQRNSNSQYCYQIDNNKGFADRIKLKSDPVAAMANNLENFENRSENVIPVFDNEISNCPKFTSDSPIEFNPGILSEASGNQEISDIKDKPKDKRDIIFDSLAITPSFVSTKALSVDHVTVQRDSLKPWHFDSESEDLTLSLGFDCETQLADDQSKDHISSIRTNVDVTDSKHMSERNVQESLFCTLQQTDDQNEDNTTNTCTLSYNVETQESEKRCAKRHDQGPIRTNNLSQCRNIVEQCEKQDIARKSNFEKETSRCVSSQINVTLHNSHDSDSKAKSNTGLEMDSVENAFSKSCQLAVEKNLSCIQDSPLHPKGNELKSQTNSLPCVGKNYTSVTGSNFQTRKRRQSNSFSECSSKKKLKECDDLIMKSPTNSITSDNNYCKNIDSGRPDDICDASFPNALDCDQACNKESAETQQNIDNINTKSMDNYSNMVVDNSKSNLTDKTDSAKIKGCNTIVLAKDTDFSSETSDSDTSESILSQSLLKPEVPLKDNKEKNQKAILEENLSVSLSETVNNTGIADEKKIFTGDNNTGYVQVQTKKVICLESKESQTPNDAKKDFCSQNQMNEKKDYSEGSVSSSDESSQLMGEIKLEKNKSSETGDNYLDFTELDVIPFSQMELSESFLSNPEAYQTVLMKSSRRGRKNNFGIFVQRRSPRLTSGISGKLDRHDSQSLSSVSSCSSSQSSSSYSEQFVSNKIRKSRKSLMISSLFQYLVDEAKRKKSEEFYLPENQYGSLIEIKCKKMPQNASESVLKHLADTQELNFVHECSEELYSQDCSKDLEHLSSNVCETEALKDASLWEASPSKEQIPETKCAEQSIQIETEHSLVNHSHTDSSQSKPNIVKDECQEHIFQKENLCYGESKLSQCTNNVYNSQENVTKTSTDPHSSTCSTNTTVAEGAMSPVRQTQQQVTSEQKNGSKCLPLMNTEVSILSPDRGSVHGDACLPTGCASSESSPETLTSSQSSSETCKSFHSSSDTTSAKGLRKNGLKYLSCFQTGKSEPVLSLTAGTVMSNNDKIQFVACMSESSVSLWSSDKLDEWTNELDWLLPVGYCANNLWLLPHPTEVVLVISGVKDEAVSWVLLFVYRWQTGESSRLNLDLPETRLTNSKNNLLCCPLMDQQVILCCNTANRSLVQKYSFADSLAEVTSRQPLETTQHSLLSLSVVEGLNLALVGLSLDSHILVWNHKIGILLTQIDVTLILPSPMSLASVQSVKGYLLLIVTNRNSTNPGYFLAINPQIGISKLLFNFENYKDEIQSFRQSVVNDRLLTAVDGDGDVVLWDKHYGGVVAHLPQSHATALHLSDGLLVTGHETGCVHVMQIR